MNTTQQKITKKVCLVAIIILFIILVPHHIAFTGSVAETPQSHPQGSVSSIPPDDETLQQRWDLSQIQAVEAWRITAGKPEIRVAVLDTGIDSTHPALSRKVVASVSFTESPVVDDLNGHGTHIAGIIAASPNSFSGLIGLAENSQLMNIKVANDDGFCNATTIAKGIIWAAENGANVINISLVINKPSSELEDAVNYAWDNGVVVVAAAGNCFNSAPTYPAFYPNTIAVAATDTNDRVPSWSNRGEWVDVAAPGVAIYSAAPEEGSAWKSGTSMAAALVSAEAALLFAIATDANGNGKVNDEVRAAIEESSDTMDRNGIGKGRINVLKALEFLITPRN